MPPSRRWTDRVRAVVRDDSGSASLEFVTVGLSAAAVPIVYLVLALSALESASFGVEGAARQATRVVRSVRVGRRRRVGGPHRDPGHAGRLRARRARRPCGDQLPPESGLLPHPARVRDG